MRAKGSSCSLLLLKEVQQKKKCQKPNLFRPSWFPPTQLKLIEGINNDVLISAVISGGQVFLQLPLHPSYPQLNMLQHCMNQSYTYIDAPAMTEFPETAICAAPVFGGGSGECGTAVDINWYRVQIISHNPHTDSVLVKYLDYGGYGSVHAKDLRQIRHDFMTVPFQTVEVLLANIKPVGKWPVQLVWLVPHCSRI